MSMQKLWTKNFTIITLGTVVSMLGNAISGFAIGLLVLDYTDSTFLFALFMVVYNLPKIIMPMLAGPYLDNFSRARVIYSLDFLSSALYLGIYFLLRFDLFSYGPFLALAFLIGAIDGVYQVAYDSLYPTLISPGNLMRAYSISSMIAPVSMVMVPVAAYLYEVMGRLDPLFLFNALSFLVAACFETQIRAPETQTLHHDAPFTPAKFREDFRAGLRYLRGERGLQIITAYFFVYMFAFGASGTVVLPYFKMHEDLGMLWYCFVMGGGVLGRLLGGAIQYRYRFPASRKFGRRHSDWRGGRDRGRRLSVFPGGRHDAPVPGLRPERGDMRQPSRILHAELCARRLPRPLQRRIPDDLHAGHHFRTAAFRGGRRYGGRASGAGGVYAAESAGGAGHSLAGPPRRAPDI